MLDVVVTERCFSTACGAPVAPAIAPIVAEGIVAHDGIGAGDSFERALLSIPDKGIVLKRHLAPHSIGLA